MEEHYKKDEDNQLITNICVDCYFDKKEEKVAKFVYDGKSMCEECVEIDLNLKALEIESAFI